jgi:hypothetical protein
MGSDELPQSVALNTKRSIQNQINVAFRHGLGDCVHFSRLVSLYIARGFNIGVACTPDKRMLFEAAGARLLESSDGAAIHNWGNPVGETFDGHGNHWIGSKIGHNISEWPLPNIGNKEQLWQELVSNRVDVAPLISNEDRQVVQRWLSRLAKPVTLFHSKGNSAQDRKSLPDTVAAEFYREFLDQCQGTLILLDWDRRVPRLSSGRVRHLDDIGSCSTARMLTLMLEADLLIGVNSGPLHAAGLTGLPAIGVWMPGYYPAAHTLPRRNQLNVVLGGHTRQSNKFKRIPWRIIEHSGESFDADQLAQYCHLMQSSPRYLKNDKAADIQFQQFVLDWCRCRSINSLSDYWDRNRSFDVLFREIAVRFNNPVIVETGTIRAEEDWSGAGFFSYLAGCFLFHNGGGCLHSVDINPDYCAFAKQWTEQFGTIVQIYEQDSLAFLSSFKQSIDVLYLDSLDTTEPNHAQHALSEFRAAEHQLHEWTIVCVDDSPWHAGAYVGKGALLIPYLLKSGWKILYAGYQVLMSKTQRATTDDGFQMRL